MLSILMDLKDWLHLDCEPKNILSLGLHYVAELHCCACLLNYLAGIYKWPYASHFGLRGKSTHWIYDLTNKNGKNFSNLSLNQLYWYYYIIFIIDGNDSLEKTYMLWNLIRASSYYYQIKIKGLPEHLCSFVVNSKSLIGFAISNSINYPTGAF